MRQAIALTRALWDGKETARILPGPTVVHRMLDLLATMRLGRKRILDTALAATLESAGVTRLATLNAADFRVFSFLEVVDPAVGPRRVRG
jgi:predicted nucleic acid-binding protein